jgi:hypothetical protein
MTAHTAVTMLAIVFKLTVSIFIPSPLPMIISEERASPLERLLNVNPSPTSIRSVVLHNITDSLINLQAANQYAPSCRLAGRHDDECGFLFYAKDDQSLTFLCRLHRYMWRPDQCEMPARTFTFQTVGISTEGKRFPSATTL